MQKINVIGAGLSGCEAAYQISKRGMKVFLYEQKPQNFSPAHKSANFCELVCSNSLKNTDVLTASGMLKQEMRLFNSLVLSCAFDSKVPAGNALAVDRDLFSGLVTKKIREDKNIKVIEEEVTKIDKDETTIIATGPLTSDGLMNELKHLCNESLFFFDAAAPIIDGESIDYSKTFNMNRYNKSNWDNGYVTSINFQGAAESGSQTGNSRNFGASERTFGTRQAQNAKHDERLKTCVERHVFSEEPSEGRFMSAPEGEYVNCPLTKEEYEKFYSELINAKTLPLKDFEKNLVFESCMPVEIMAKRGIDTLRFGPLKPAGLYDEKNNVKPYAVLQLRRENLKGTYYNLVGFQTNLLYAEQKRVFSLIPALKNAEYVKYGVMHKNTYINSPKLLDNYFRLKDYQNIFIAGQLSGVEGYLESCASGLICGINAYNTAQNLPLFNLSGDTLMGAMSNYISNPANENFQPINSNYGILNPLDKNYKNKDEKKKAYLDRSILEITKKLQL
ncbi:MAG: methylenetetrahydrofolate--tRNA-(uracil(54)-C(5))-methyltransferase (FADH(2)-oxidizing) TrmFO [Firmicutes bacterium]|nr:methylenetetrahydrofolate--tRNA-(uracil(54)-C(5))-methyltransferase (FADH(2)-oxidizing) TrmFO [Bacillota bacterium]